MERLLAKYDRSFFDDEGYYSDEGEDTYCADLTAKPLTFALPPVSQVSMLRPS